MNDKLQIDNDMIRRIKFARDNGSTIAQRLLDTFEQDEIPDDVVGRWWTKKVTRHGKTKDIRVKFQKPGSYYEREMMMSEFPRRFLGDLGSTASGSTVTDEIYEFWELMLVPTVMSMRVISKKEDIKKLFSGINFYSDYDNTLQWSHNIRTGFYGDRFGAMCADFFTKILPARFVVCYSDRGKVLGYATILDNAIYRNDLLAKDRPVRLLLGPQFVREGVYRWMRRYFREHAKELGFDITIMLGDYLKINEDMNLDEDEEIRRPDGRMIVPLNIDESYVGGFPNQQVLPSLMYIVRQNGNLYLSDSTRGLSLVQNSWSWDRADGRFFHCVKCEGDFDTMGDGTGGYTSPFCANCYAPEGGVSTVFGTVYTGKRRKVKGYGYLPASCLDSNGKPNSYYIQARMLEKFRSEPVIKEVSNK